MKYPSYPEMEDLGIEWLGKIPEHWTYYRLVWLLQSLESGMRQKGGGNQLDEGIFSLGGEHIGKDCKLKLDNSRYISEEFYQNMKKGKINEKDVLLVKDGATIGKLCFIEKKPFVECAVNSHIYILRGRKNLLNKFLYYYLLSLYGQNQIDMEITGAAQGGLSSDFVSKFILCLPPFQEQKSIADFLDRETKLIDLLIEKKEKLIELLEEKRQAIISKSVTKGLDPDVPMKDSGIEWLGEIPEHWDITKLKYISDINGRIGYRGYTKEDLVEEGEGALTLGAKHIDDRHELDLTDPEYLSWEKYYESPEIMIKEGNLVIAQRGSIGKVAIIEENIGEATINPSLVLLNDIKSYNKYLYYILTSNLINNFLNMYLSSTAVPMISQEQIKSFLILLPPKSEQKCIANFLDQKTKKIDELKNKIQKQISNLEEYRQALITNAVTGKIDVRDLVEEEELNDNAS